MSLRLVGPTLGFLFGSLCLRIYISPSLTPMIKNNDPRWLGAWWLGKNNAKECLHFKIIF